MTAVSKSAFVGLCLTAGALVSAQQATTPAPAPSRPSAAVAATTTPAPGGGRRIEILFFGHTSTHHDSTRFSPMLKAALAPNGFNFSYTTDQNDLNSENLANYDALMIYANNTKITAEQEKALLDFVASGKGLLPIHSASFCFQNSEPYIALVGAQFQKHGVGEFTAEIVKKDHPVMDGITPFEVWDETYVHHKHNATDRTVLMERVDAAGREPWTWVRTHGKGRVFYTAYGHDQRVWSHAMFHKLVQNGILWAVNPAVKAQWQKLAIQPLQYTKGAVPVPNYERRTPAPLLQQPLTTREAAKHFQIPPGFELTLFASEPLIQGNPMAMAWDARGRLWLLESKDYPNNRQPPGQGNDVVKIIEDTNGDGRADKSTVFADKLSITSGLVFANGGVIVSVAGEFVFLKDTNGDDKADVRQELITGWGTNDTHALASNLKYGIDNWLYGAVGYSGFNGTIEGKPLRMSQALYRFSADGKRMQHMANFTNNTWGLAFNETNDLFGSTANNDHSFYVPITLNYYEGVSGLAGLGRKKIDGHYAVAANTQKIRQVDVFGGFTAVGGHNFYTARAFPKDYWNRVAFVNEPTVHIVHRAIIERKGSGFAEADGWNLVASDDEWMSPVHSEVGPDGAVWFLDFYDFIIQHNPTPSGLNAQGHTYVNGRGNAYDSPLRETAHGRIYRLAWKGAKPYTPMALSADRPADLVAALKNDNMLWRLHAQRLLVERAKPDVLPQLIALVNDRAVDTLGLNPGALHALWTMHGLGALDGKNAQALDAARSALTHPAGAVRKAAHSVLPPGAQTLGDLLAAKVLEDKDLNVRLNAFLAISTMPASLDAGKAIYAASKVKENVEDEWLPEAIAIAASKHLDGFYAAYINEVGAAQFTRVAVRGARGERETVIDWSAPGLDTATGWPNIPMPQVWSATPLGEHLGVVWLRREIDMPAAAAGKAATLALGIVDEQDVTYINGSRVGATTQQGANLVRTYAVPAGVLLPGRNVVAIRVTNPRGRGGMVPDLKIPVAITGEGFNVPLAGQWRHRVQETWEGGRRREFSTSVPLAEQIALRNSPVTDIVKPDPVPVVAGGRGAGPGGAGAGGGGRGRGGVAPLVVGMTVITGENKFSQTAIAARPGQRIEINFENTDDMQHNIVFFQRGSMLTYEKELTAQLTDPTAQARGYVPDSPSVVFATPMVNARGSVSVAFNAPMEPGNYPFVCSFPGHWFTMRGVLTVAAQ